MVERTEIPKPGSGGTADADTQLTAHMTMPDGQFFEVTDDAYADIARTRGVLVSDKAPVMVVLDSGTAPEPVTWQNQWQLGPDWDKGTLTGSNATFTSAKTKALANVVSVPLPGGGGAAVPEIYRGTENPFRGWYSAGDGLRVPASAVQTHRKTDKFRQLTVIAHTPSGVPAQVTTRAVPGGTELQIRTGTLLSSVVVGADNRPVEGSLRTVPAAAG